MIRWTYNYFTKLPPIPSVYIDGCLYVAIAFFGAVTAVLSTDEAAKYISPIVLWYARSICSIMAASTLALKMFRSTGFADHKEQQKKTGDTQVFARTEGLTSQTETVKS